MILGIDHVGIAVRSEAARRTFETLLDAEASEAETLPAYSVRVCFVPPAAPNLELLQPSDDNGAVARYLERRGEGLHHVCFAVDDVAAELRRLIDAGFDAIDQAPREGHGGLVAFLHPRSAHGVLIELLQRTASRPRGDSSNQGPSERRAAPGDAVSLLEAARGGDRRSLARALTLVERGGDAADGVIAAARGSSGAAHVVGITGAPGVGKSTLAAALAEELRRRGRTVAILAVDPSSPHSGGALLGDRVRMDRLHGDLGVFVRSLASRGAVGGLAPAAHGSLLVLAAAGFDDVLVETVGAGQSDLDVAAAAQTVVLVVAPGLGDGIQALKAGIVEIADVIVVNKADRDGADQLVADFEFARGSLDGGASRTPIVKTSTITGEGVPALADALLARRDASPLRARSG